MKILYKVWYREYGSPDKKLSFIGSLIDYWSEIDYTRGRELAKNMYAIDLQDKDPNAIIVTVGKNPEKEIRKE